jgi:hypothetical protein
MRKSFEEKEQLREKRDRLLAKERAMVEEKKQNKRGERERREERQKQRMANEYKNSMYQEVSFICLLQISDSPLADNNVSFPYS